MSNKKDKRVHVADAFRGGNIVDDYGGFLFHKLNVFLEIFHEIFCLVS